METRREICSKPCKMGKHQSYLQRLTLLMPCSLFANKVLPYIQPGAIIMGGDLVDAKTLFMQGHQYRQEWEVCTWHAIMLAALVQMLSPYNNLPTLYRLCKQQWPSCLTPTSTCTSPQDYRNVLESFKEATGLPEEALLDVRGNHDAFDVPDRYSSNIKHHYMQPRHGVYVSVDRQIKPSSAAYHDGMAEFVRTLHARLLYNTAHALSNPIFKQFHRVCAHSQLGYCDETS